MSAAHLFRKGTPLIFATLLEGNESTDWPKVTWVSRELLFSGFDHFVQFHLYHATLGFGSLSLWWNGEGVELPATYYSQHNEFCIQKPVNQNAVSFIICILNIIRILYSWIKESRPVRRDNFYRHKYPSTLIVIPFTYIFKVFDQTVSKNLIFQTSFNDGDNAGVDSIT